MYSGNRVIAVGEIMSSPVVKARENESIRRVAAKMKAHDVDSVVIVNKRDEPVGIVTEGDVVRRLISRKRNLLFVKAKHAMTKPLHTIEKSASMEQAAQGMVEKKIRRLCVMHEGRLVGIVSQSDIIKNTNALIGVLREIIDTGYTRTGETAEVIQA